jgi:hypothetical protein
MKLTTLLFLVTLPAFAPFDARLARCPAPYSPSPVARAIAHREGFFAPWTLPHRLNNPCALRPGRTYLRFPDPESGWLRCEQKLIEMSEPQIKSAWNLGDDKLGLRILEEVRRKQKLKSYK